MSDDPVVGIDLGTTFSAVAAIDRHGQPRVLPNLEGKRTTPSVVYFEEGGGVVVGEMARNQALADPTRTVQFIKREMGNPSFQLTIDGVDYVPEAISALILEKLRSDAEAHLGAEVRRAVVSVPAYFKDSQRLATQKAGEIAGLDVVAIINEPTAAAIAYGLARGEEHRHVMVYDFGGGTFDVTILRIEGNEFTVVATDGDSRLGGIDVDERLADHLAGRFLDHHGLDLRDDPTSKLDLWQRAEVAKIDLSTRQSVKVTLSSGGQAMRVDVDRDTLNDLASDLLARTEECMTRALAGGELGWESIDAVLLVGGSSRMAAVKELIRRLSGKEPSADVNPDECVALGAALRADMEVKEMSGVLPVSDSEVDSAASQEVGIVVHDVAPHSLGVRAVNSEGRPVNSIIIPRLTQVPCERTRTYATRAENQRSIEIEVLQGEDEDPFSIDVEGVGRVKVDDLPKRPAGQVVVAVALRYDADGVVEVVAEELLEGRVVRQQLLQKSGELDPETIAEMQSQVETLTAAASEAPTSEGEASLEHPNGSDRESVSDDPGVAASPEEATRTEGEPDSEAGEPASAPGVIAEGQRGEVALEDEATSKGDQAEDHSDGEVSSDEGQHETSLETPAGPQVDHRPAGGDVDLYSSLGVSPTATTHDIETVVSRKRQELLERKRSASESLGPDAPEQTAIDQELASVEEAATILLDDTARADYDTLGPAAPNQNPTTPGSLEHSGEDPRD